MSDNAKERVKRWQDANRGTCQCGASIYYRSKMCKDCARTSQTKDITLAEAINSKSHRSSAFALVRTRARYLMRFEPQVCSHCGYDKHVEVCHIKAISSYPDTTLVSEINSKENLILLCPNCHWEFDHL